MTGPFHLEPANLNVFVFMRAVHIRWPVIRRFVVVLGRSFADQRGYFSARERGLSCKC